MFFWRKGLKFRTILAHLKMMGEKAPPPLADFRKQQIWNKIVRSIEVRQEVSRNKLSWKSLMADLRNLGQSIAPTPYVRAIIHERLYARLTQSNNFSRDFLALFLGRKRVWAGLILTSFLVALFLPFQNSEETIFAARRSVLTVDHGMVTVQRDGNKIEPLADFILEEGDVIETGADSQATVTFFDGSVSRLDVSTRLAINTLLYAPLEQTNTILSLDNGRLWSKVAHLIGDLSSFEVLMGASLVKTNRSAVFSLITDDKATKVVAINNPVDFHYIESPEKVLKKTLVPGNVVEVNRSKSVDENSMASTVVVKHETVSRDDPWIVQNKEKDLIYEETVSQEQVAQVQEQAGMLSDNPLYPIKTLSEQADLTLTFDKTVWEKKRLALALQRLIEAGSLTLQGKEADAEKSLINFRNGIDAFVVDLDILKRQSPDVLEDVLLEIRPSFSELKRLFASVPPETSLYAIKNLIRETELLLTTSAFQRYKLVLEHNSERLVEISGLLKTSSELVIIDYYLDNYKQHLQSVTDGVLQLSAANYTEMSLIVLDLLIDDLGVSKSLESMAVNSNFKKTVAILKANILAAMNRILTQPQPLNLRLSIQTVILSNNNNEIVQRAILTNLQRQIYNPLIQKKIDEILSLFQERTMLITDDLEGRVEINNSPDTFVVLPATPNADLGTHADQADNQPDSAN